MVLSFFVNVASRNFQKKPHVSYVKQFKRLNGALSLAVLRTVATETAVSRIIFIALQYEEESKGFLLSQKFRTADD